MKNALRLAALLSCTFFATTLPHAERISREEVPEPLRPWVDWVLHHHEEAGCPFFQGSEDHRQCLWPSRLELDLEDRSGTFAQDWLVHFEEWVPLPGDTKLWPQQVRVDGRSATVVSREGVPSLRLKPGRHDVTGTFAWDALPPQLQIPTLTGLLTLNVRGREIRFPLRDERGQLWLRERAGEERGESQLEVVVHRKVTDEIPLLLESRIEIQAAGKNREVDLGRPLPDSFVPMSLAGPLPARLEADGRLRVQIRPGRWVIFLTARHEGPASSLTLPANEEPWDSEEVWVFDARTHLRLVEVEGIPAVDPQQTTLPDEWKQFPAYLVQAGATMSLVEKRRGDSSPAPDRLALERSWWLDFDGGGFTIRDKISGRLERNWRLDMQPPATLGRAAVNDRDQFITVNTETGHAGVELRQTEIRLEADSRLESRDADIPAVGWDHDFHQVSGRLHLPPGWRLFHASGVDDVSKTWLASWTLLDLFLVLIISMAVARLWSWRFGLLAILTLALTWIEKGAPQWIWLLVLAGEALRRALSEGRARQLVTIGHRLALVLLLVFTVPFLVRQVRSAIYPALEEPIASYRAAGAGGPGGAGMGRASNVLVEQKAAEEDAYGVQREMAPVAGGAVEIAGNVLSGTLSASAPLAPPPPLRKRFSSLYVPDPKTVIQTGPGLPEWSWREVRLSWRGPVERTQRLVLTLLSPRVNFALAFLRIALLVLLALRVLPIPPGTRPGRWLGRVGLARAASAALAMLLISLSAGTDVRADIPSEKLLRELRDRLLEKPECFPECASSPRMVLEVNPTSLTLRLDIHAAADTAVPLPGGTDAWMPTRVLLDGVPAPGLARSPDGRLWIRLPIGQHQVLMEGRLPDRETVPLPLPLRPHQVTARARGWRVEGLHEDGRPADNLQLTRIRAEGADPSRPLEPGRLPPFVRVERELNLGLQWEMETRVVRMTPPGSAIVLTVPLLDGESVTTEGIRVDENRASINMGPGVLQVDWTSTLTQASPIRLRAPEEVSWTEVWRVAASQVWHLEVDGIPSIHLPGQEEPRQREWRPWPGEAVTIRAGRPEGLAGRTLTLDKSHLTLSPGLRATDATLDLSLRSSRGTQHTLTLPETAELQSVSFDGVIQPIHQEGREVTLPVRPGPQGVTLSWRQKPGIGLLFRTPMVQVGMESVNAASQIAMPRDRWTLFLGGPRLGPAVLFWSFLFVTLLVSIGLGQLRSTPLRWYHWFLLSLGLTQVSIWVALPIILWLVALGRRNEWGPAGNIAFDLMQLALVALTMVALTGLFVAIQRGLLGFPEMQIAGNGSSAGVLQWYQDRSGESLPQPWVFSLPLMVYRLAMLAWALWLAQALLRWLRWGWGCFSKGGIWRPIREKEAEHQAAKP